MQKINLNERFTLCLKVSKVNIEKIKLMLDQGGFASQRWQQTPYSGFVEFRVDVNLRQAEIIRQLLKNINVYD